MKLIISYKQNLADYMHNMAMVYRRNLGRGYKQGSQCEYAYLCFGRWHP